MTNGEDRAKRQAGSTHRRTVDLIGSCHSSFVICWTCTSHSSAHSFRGMKSLLSTVALVCLVSLVAGAEQKFSGPPAQKVFPVALPNYDEETATRLQIFLDNSNFGPGKI